MSVSLDKVPVTLVEDSRLTYPEWSLPARFGGSAMNYSVQGANGMPGAGGGPVSFIIRTNNPVGSSVAPTLIWRNVVEFTITGVAGNTTANLLNPGYSDAPRAYPMTSCCNNVKLEINGQSTDFPYLDQVGHVLRRFNPRVAMYKTANFCPWYPDSGCTRYFDLLNTNRNPLGSGGVGDLDFTRGCYQKVTYTNGGQPGGTAQNSGSIILETFEPVNISPFIYDMQGKGIPYIETLGLTFYTSNLYRALSRAAGTLANGNVLAAITSANVTGKIKTSELYYQQINLPLWAREIAPVVKFPYYRVRAQSCGTNTLGASAQGVPALGPTQATGDAVTSLIINYDCIPSRIYVFVQPPQERLAMHQADFTFMYTGNLQVTWGNNTYMSSVTPQQLYTSAVDGGYAFPWENFGGSYLLSQNGNNPAPIGSSGSIICLRPGIDFPLEPGQVVGMGGQFSIQVRGSFRDQRPLPVDASVIGAADGICNMWVVAVVVQVTLCIM